MKPTTFHVGPGAIIQIEQEILCVKRWDTSSSVVVRSLRTLAERVVTIKEITDSFAKVPSGEQADLSAVENEDWDEAISRYQALQPLADNPNRTRVDVAQVAASLLVSVPTAYRWLAAIERYGTITVLLRKRRKDKGVKRLAPPVEDILHEVLVNDYLTKLKRSPVKALREVARQCRLKGLDAPVKSTLLRRIDEILPEERARKREGRNAAVDLRPHRGTLPGVDNVNSIWQIDHTLVDIELVDEKDRIVIGRPWITVAMDVYTRMVVGWYVSFDPPGTLGTGICISTAILPKDDLVAKLGLAYSWPCQGKPGVIHADNAKEFRGETLSAACQEHGFDLKFRKVKKPNYGAHIERLLGTLLEEIHGLEGTTFSDPKSKGEYGSEENACMTLGEFEVWLANLILGAYHNRPHSSLQMAPIRRYQEGILGTDDVPGIGLMPIAADPEKLKIDFLPFELRTIQPYGCVLDYIEYYSPVLDKWIGATDPKTKRLARKFIFRRDPRNISFLYFWDPDARLYYQIPFRDARRAAISLWELRAITAYLKRLGKDDINEELIFSAFEEMKRIEDQAKQLTKSQRLLQERRRHHKKHGPTSPPPNETISRTEDKTTSKGRNPLFDPATIIPFDEVEPT